MHRFTLDGWAVFADSPEECRKIMNRVRDMNAAEDAAAAKLIEQAVTVTPKPRKRGTSHRINQRESRVRQRRQSIYTPPSQLTREEQIDRDLQRSLKRIEPTP